MADLDPEQHQVVFRIAVIGGVAQRFLELNNAKDGELELPPKKEAPDLDVPAWA